MMTTHGIRRVLFLADSTLLADELLDPARFDSRALAQGAEVVPAGDGSFKVGVSFDFGDVELQWVAARGCVISSLWHNGTIVLSSFLSQGLDPAADTEVLSMYLRSIRRTKLVAELSPGNPAPFAEFETCRERPFYGAILIPMLPREQCDALVDFHTSCAAAFLWSTAKRAH